MSRDDLRMVREWALDMRNLIEEMNSLLIGPCYAMSEVEAAVKDANDKADQAEWVAFALEAKG